MKNRTASRLSSERGATLVHVAIALVSLMGIAAYAVDRGIVWMSRGQAQNAADAGALAGATARGFDEFSDPPPVNGIAESSARYLAGWHNVWGTPGVVGVSWGCPFGVVGLCTRVDVYRDNDNGNPLPVVFANVLGIGSQNVRATATA